jgi:hypothetical protein
VLTHCSCLLAQHNVFVTHIRAAKACERILHVGIQVCLGRLVVLCSSFSAPVAVVTQYLEHDIIAQHSKCCRGAACLIIRSMASAHLHILLFSILETGRSQFAGCASIQFTGKIMQDSFSFAEESQHGEAPQRFGISNANFRQRCCRGSTNRHELTLNPDHHIARPTSWRAMKGS